MLVDVFVPAPQYPADITAGAAIVGELGDNGTVATVVIEGNTSGSFGDIGPDVYLFCLRYAASRFVHNPALVRTIPASHLVRVGSFPSSTGLLAVDNYRALDPWLLRWQTSSRVVVAAALAGRSEHGAVWLGRECVAG